MVDLEPAPGIGAQGGYGYQGGMATPSTKQLRRRCSTTSRHARSESPAVSTRLGASFATASSGGLWSRRCTCQSARISGHRVHFFSHHLRVNYELEWVVELIGRLQPFERMPSLRCNRSALRVRCEAPVGHA